jgi:CRP-like cAMP-binding protein
LKTIEKLLFLQDLEEFRKVSTDHLARLAAVARHSEVSQGSRLFGKGDQPTELILVVYGRVSVESPPGPARLVHSSSLDIFSVLSREPHAFSARTHDDCLLLKVSYDDLIDLLEAEAELCLELVRFLAASGRQLQLDTVASHEAMETRF